MALLGLRSPIRFEGYRLYPPNSAFCECARLQGAYIDAEKIVWRDGAALAALGLVDFVGIVHDHFNRHDVELETNRWGSAQAGEASEHRRRLDEQRVPLVRPLTEFGGSALINHLHRTKRRQISVHEGRLHVPSIDRGVRLKEDADKEVRREEVASADDVYQRAASIGIRREANPLELVFE